MDCSNDWSPKDLVGEKWVAITRYEGHYEVSNMGRVRSLFRGTMKIRRSYVDSKGYYQVRLCKPCGGETLRVHRLVAVAFIPNPLNLPEVNHLNGKLDNRVVSLEWSTSSDNQKHAYKNKLRVPLGGEKNPKCRLSEKQVLCIFNSVATAKEKAKKYGISIHTVAHIMRGSTWTYLTGKKYVIKNKKCG